ncbi:MAG: DegT/DnrJ/EryC1/StrS family aminotransferase, partial [Desulfobacterales bacterium]
MTIIGSVPRRCVNLPPGSFVTLIRSILGGNRPEATIEKFHEEFANWLGASHALGTSSGRSAFQLALQALEMKKGAEIIFPVFTFPVIPLVAKLLGYQPVFCEVDPKS